MFISPEPWEICEVRDEVCQVDRNDSPGLTQDTETPALLVHDGETLEESENQSIGETGEQGKTEDDGLSQEHMEGSNPNLSSFLQGNTGFLKLVGSVYVGVFTSLATTLGLTVKKDGGARFGHEEDDGLSDTTEDQLDPEEPFPAEDYKRGD